MASASPRGGGIRFLPPEGCRRARDTAGGASIAVFRGFPVSAEVTAGGVEGFATTADGERSERVL